MTKIHPEFNNLPLNQDFAIDDVISGLETRLEEAVNWAETKLGQAKTRSGPVDFGQAGAPAKAAYSFKDITNSQTALVIARALQDAGVETLTLDMTKPMTEQVMAQVDKAGLTPCSKRYKAKYKTPKNQL